MAFPTLILILMSPLSPNSFERVTVNVLLPCPKPSQVRKSFLTGLVFLLSSCGYYKSRNGKSEADGENTTTSRVVVVDPASSSPVSLSVGFVDEVNESGFSLVGNITAFDVSLVNCLSGYTSAVDESSVVGLKVYKGDRSCGVNLTSFVLDGHTYTQTTSDPFDTFAQGDVATFEDVSTPGSELKVVIVSALQNPVLGTEPIKFGLTSLDKGADRSLLWAEYGVVGTIKNKNYPLPSFTLKSVQYVGQTAGEGGQFKFTLECTSLIGLTNICAGVNFTDIDYKLVFDAYNDRPSKGQASNIFSSAGHGISLPQDRIAPGIGGLLNGGFVTAVLDGPDNLATQPNMILILRTTLTTYQYFNIDMVVDTTF